MNHDTALWVEKVRTFDGCEKFAKIMMTAKTGSGVMLFCPSF
jgi:hypothetical protein